MVLLCLVFENGKKCWYLKKTYAVTFVKLLAATHSAIHSMVHACFPIKNGNEFPIFKVYVNIAEKIKNFLYTFVVVAQLVLS